MHHTWQCAGGLKKQSWQSRVNFGLPAQKNPVPPNPFPDPPNEKGVNLLRIQAAICLHSSHAKYCITWRAIGQKLVCARSCTDHLFSAQIQPKPLPKHFVTAIMQLMHNAMRKLQVWNLLLVICLNTPPRPTRGHSMQFYDQAPRPPPYIKSPNKAAKRLGLSWGFQKYIYIYFVKVAQ